MNLSVFGALRGALVLCAAVVAAGCSVTAQSVQLDPRRAAGTSSAAAAAVQRPQLTVTPAVIPSDGAGVIRIIAPGADSVALESGSGVDRYSRRGNMMTVRVTGHFGELSAETHYAVRERGMLFDVVKRPIKVTACRQRQCVDYYETLTIKLPERNERSVALTGGWATAFTRRAITGENKSVLLREALNNSLWSLQAEVATKGINARLQGYYNNGEQGGSLDLSRTFRRTTANEMGYGLAVHFSTRRIDWLLDGSGAALPRRTAYQASVGPSIMLKGLTASSQYGFYTDGEETLQLLSTVVSLNGALTEIRSPVSLTVEKTFAFGGGAIMPRRRDGTDRMIVGVQLAPNVALRLGLNSRRSAWPIEGSTGDIQVSETYYSLGAQYTLTW
jgi:hypothetical protein